MEKCTFCSHTQHHSCRNHRKVVAISAHNMVSIPPESFKGNKEEQKIVSAYIVTKNIRMNELYNKLIDDMETKKWVFKDSILVNRYAVR